jgi:hypothetical protein
VDVSLVDTIQTDVQAMTAGLGRAYQEAGAADHAAQQIAQRAAGSGFVGVAQNMARVREAISRIQAGISGLSESVREMGTAVAGAPRQPSPRHSITTFAPLTERLGSIHTGIGGCVEQVDQAKRLAGSVLQGGQPGPILARLDAIGQVLTMVAQRGRATRQHVETALSEARNTGHAGN